MRGVEARGPVLMVGIGGRAEHGCAALWDGNRVVGACEQERVTRIRGDGFNASGLPDEALDTLLSRLDRTRNDICRYAAPDESNGPPLDAAVERLDLHLTYASTAYRSSPFPSATILVCDSEAPFVSAWKGRGATIRRLEWPWQGPGFTDIFAQAARLFGFGRGGAQRLEALARLMPGYRDARIDRLITADETTLSMSPSLPAQIRTQLAGRKIGGAESAAAAASVQSRIGELFVALLERLRSHSDDERLCLGGSLFYHSSINTLAKSCRQFSDVFIPVNPGKGGLAVGAVLNTAEAQPRLVSPFLGPAYTPDDIKATLDNCKLGYAWETEDTVIARAVEALVDGRLVAWFEDAMEWGPRALGARSIVANPFAPYVLENLNHFLKHREPWRGYALSILGDVAPAHFDGPEGAPFMECDYKPRDRTRFRAVLPGPDAWVRLHTVRDDSPPRFRRLLHAFGAATGIPALVNTSFNGFHEPIVCTARDALRVFYGTGLDLAILDRFVLEK